MKGYQPVRVKYVPITRKMRNEYMTAAAVAWHEKFKTEGIDLVTFEAELARKCIQWWDIPKVHVTIGWDLLADEVGDAISEAVGIAEVIKGVMGKLTQAAEDAKNSDSGSQSPTQP